MQLLSGGKKFELMNEARENISFLSLYFVK